MQSTNIFKVIAVALLWTAGAHAQTVPAEPAADGLKLSSRDKLDLYLLIGQSNMVGRDTRQMDLQKATSRLISLNVKGEWVIAKDPLHAANGRILPGVGPGISFGCRMLENQPSVTIGLIPCAVGGTPLRRWVKGADLYENALSRARLACQSGVLKGVLWLQGESDSSSENNAGTYQVRLVKMFQDLRSDLGSPDLPIVVGQIGPFLEQDKYPYAETVRTAIRSMPGQLPKVGYADSAGLMDQGDHLHYSSESAREMGLRFAAAMMSLQSTAASPRQ